jgi:hypothetical protein
MQELSSMFQQVDETIKGLDKAFQGPPLTAQSIIESRPTEKPYLSESPILGNTKLDLVKRAKQKEKLKVLQKQIDKH